ncbi:META domain-containing protein [Psychromonas hadalis]|uniref:META domain-containing protein n=1 Tax=Psychromonas hadalis TaxID=211669 RepID=UPI0003B4F714|nr:META domain-containing protein [Psychromonas hadalis]
MKKLYWILIAIAISVALAEGYALYNIPKAVTINGQLHYEYSIEVEPSTIFKLSLESRAQGETKFAILAASEGSDFSNFPQLFKLPVLTNSLSDVGIYQLRVQVINNHNVLYVNKGLLPLTRADLSQPLTIEMQIPPKPRKKIMIAKIMTPTPRVIEIITATPSPVPEPVKLDIQNLLGNKFWVLQTKQRSKAHLSFDMEKNYAFGSGGCNKFQGSYQIEEGTIMFNQFISSSKYCAGLMEVEKYFLAALPKVKKWQVKEEGKALYLYGEDKTLLLQFMVK